MAGEAFHRPAGDDPSEDDPYSGPEWKLFERRVRMELVPKLQGSAYVMSLVPDAKRLDVKFSVELGAAIMLDKPIIAVVRPGMNVPLRLARVADAILEFDDDMADNVRRLNEVMRRMDIGLPPLPEAPSIDGGSGGG